MKSSDLGDVRRTLCSDGARLEPARADSSQTGPGSPSSRGRTTTTRATPRASRSPTTGWSLTDRRPRSFTHRSALRTDYRSSRSTTCAERTVRSRSRVPSWLTKRTSSSPNSIRAALRCTRRSRLQPPAVPNVGTSLPSSGQSSRRSRWRSAMSLSPVTQREIRRDGSGSQSRCRPRNDASEVTVCDRTVRRERRARARPRPACRARPGTDRRPRWNARGRGCPPTTLRARRVTVSSTKAVTVMASRFAAWRMSASCSGLTRTSMR